jgi:hypothetical protein
MKNQLKMFSSTERAPEDNDCMLSGTPDIPDPQDGIVYTPYTILYPAKIAIETVIENVKEEV